MYNQFFGFSQNPFTIAPDPNFLFFSPQHQDGYGHLRYGVTQQGGFVLLSGEVGTGKTTLCRKLLTELPENTDIAFVLHPKLNCRELLETICDELEIEYQPNQSEKHFVDRIYQYLLNAHGQGRNTILIVDEAQNLAPDVLEQIRLLTNLETNHQKLLQIILIGQPEILELLAQPQLRQLNQRITARCHLGPLNAHETHEYLQFRISVAASQNSNLVSNLFDSKVAKAICRHSRGIPRLINVLADRCLMAAYVGKKLTVELYMVEQAAKEVLPSSSIVSAPSKGGSFTPNLSGLRLDRWFRPFMASMAVIAVLLIYKGQVENAARNIFENNQVENLNPSGLDELNVKDSKSNIDSKNKSEIGQNTVVKPFDGLAKLKQLQFSTCQESLLHQCVSAKGGFNSIAQLDDPLIVKVNYNGVVDWMVVETIDSEDQIDNQKQRTWLLYLNKKSPSAGETMILSSSQFSRIYQGEYGLLWKPPNEYKQPLKPGQNSDLVKWVRVQLPSVTEELMEEGWEVIKPAGEATAMPKISESKNYSAQLVEDVKRFQQQRGLVVDGIVGPVTIAHLQSYSRQRGWIGLQ